MLISGTSASQFILIAISPILTRLYTPEDFAILALFAALVQVAGVLANGRYDLAMLLPKSDGEAFQIGLLGVMLAAGLSGLLAVAVAVFGDAAADLWNVPGLMPWLWLLPVAVFFGGAFTAAQGFGLRLRDYRAIAGANILKSALQGSVQVVAGLVGAGPGGLVVGRTLANVGANGRLIRPAITAMGGWPGWQWSQIRALAWSYRRFPMFSAPAGLLNVFNANLMSFALPILLAPATLGFYSLAMRVLGAPLQQIAGPIGQVFMREAAEELRQTGSAHKSFLKGGFYLTLVSLVLFSSLFFLVEPLFGLVFGAEWAVAGRYAAIMMPLFAVRFIVSPLSGTAALTDNRQALLVNVVLLIVSSAVLWFAHRGDWSAETVLSGLTYSLSAVYLCFLPFLYYLAKTGGKHGRDNV